MMNTPAIYTPAAFARPLLIVLIVLPAVNVNAQSIPIIGGFGGGGPVFSASNFQGTTGTIPGDFLTPFARELDFPGISPRLDSKFGNFRISPDLLNPNRRGSVQTPQGLPSSGLSPQSAEVANSIALQDPTGVIMSPTGPVKVLDAGVSTDGALPAGQGSDSMNVNHAKASVILLKNGRVRLGDISTLQRVVPPNSGIAPSGVNTAPPVPAR